MAAQQEAVFADVELEISEATGRYRVPAHRCVLGAASGGEIGARDEIAATTIATNYYYYYYYDYHYYYYVLLFLLLLDYYCYYYYTYYYYYY